MFLHSGPSGGSCVLSDERTSC